ncbi:MAG: enoyl-CoA hydratase/isomerase family protein [Deltaproteobacteria bacterium]|nr:enoyl-CoA hydratase/isomerase family protein [Deltaproteobacteria bacterium]
MNTIVFDKYGCIGVLTLNRRDSYNAVDNQMLVELEGLFDELSFMDDVVVLVLNGGDCKGFCAGLDMKTFGPEIFRMSTKDMYRIQARLSRLLLKMRQIPQPIIAAIHGSAAGLGFSFAMASDIRIITPDARFCAAYLNIGLGGADMASSYFLPRQIGAGRAYEFLLTGEWMSADEALALGFVSKIVGKENLMSEALRIAEIIASKNHLGIKMTKEAINIALDVPSLEAALNIEDRNQVMLILDRNQKKE